MSSPDTPICSNPFDCFGIKKIPPKIRRIPCIGQVRTFNSFRGFEKVYLVLSMIALILSIGLTIQRLVVEERDDGAYTFAILLFLSIGFCFYYALHSMFTESWAGMLVFVANIGAVVIYCAVNAAKDPQGLKPVTKLVRLVILSFVSPVLILGGIYLSVKYYNSTRYDFDTMSQHEILQKAFRMFRTCVRLLVFDFQLQMSMLILVMAEGVVDMPPAQIFYLVSGIPIIICIILMGYLGLKLENTSMMILFFVFGLTEPTFIIFRFLDAIETLEKTDATYASTLTCGCFAFMVWTLLMWACLYHMKFYFNKGLRQRMLGEGENQSLPETSVDQTSINTSEVTSSVAKEMLQCFENDVSI